MYMKTENIYHQKINQKTFKKKTFASRHIEMYYDKNFLLCLFFSLIFI